MERRHALPTVVLALLVTAPLAAHDLDEETDEIARLIELAPGIRLADVGAGDGRFGAEIAHRVGPSGHVYLTEIDDDELDELRALAERREAGNLTVLAGAEDDTRLPDGCCDAVLLRYVVHHMGDPAAMHASVRRSLKTSGRLLVIEKTEPGDGIAEDDLIDAVTRAGFRVVSRHPDWGGHDGHYAVLFRVEATGGGER
ncbi:MAG TPA: methyltransferase domain-containing protein [Candidatus Polarisedimenticolaceae bacterium]|nr:methyltransferase domain-containing protein [Candidatus Polarisedimenticolaceae bacterium]